MAIRVAMITSTPVLGLISVYKLLFGNKMPTLKKIAGQPGSNAQMFADSATPKQRLTVQHSVASLRSPASGLTIDCVKLTVDSRAPVTAPGESASVVSKPTYPAVVKVIISAPDGVDTSPLMAAANAALVAFAAQPKTSLFFANVDTITY